MSAFASANSPLRMRRERSELNRSYSGTLDRGGRSARVAGGTAEAGAGGARAAPGGRQLAAAGRRAAHQRPGGRDPPGRQRGQRTR